jgi:hypothetical protein
MKRVRRVEKFSKNHVVLRETLEDHGLEIARKWSFE